MIVVVPMAGLANRMRVVDSALLLARRINSKVIVYWQKTPDELNCGFNRLFKNLPGVPVYASNIFLPDTYSSHLPGKLRSMLNKYLVAKKFKFTIANENAKEIEQNDFRLLKHIKEGDSIYIRTWERFMSGANMDKRLVPTEEISLKVLEYKKVLPASYSGFHIRRSDNVWSRNTSPELLFEKHIQKEIELGNNIFLCTDSPETEKQLIKKFGKVIFTSRKSLSRNTVLGIQDALIDFLLLADSVRIFGSYWSSFSEEAAAYRAAPLITIKA